MFGIQYIHKHFNDWAAHNLHEHKSVYSLNICSSRMKILWQFLQLMCYQYLI